MSEDWTADDPLVDPSDPAAVAREQRRREREARRRGREQKNGSEQQRQPAAPAASAVPAKPPPPPPPPSSPKPPRAARSRRPSLHVVAVLAVMALTALAVVALAYRYFDKEPPPPVVFKTTTVTIPEGLSRAQTAELARELGLEGDYLKASKGREGFLFPDTFELRKGAPASDLVQLQLEDFKGRIASVDLGYARSKNLTLRDVVTIASMVEEEAMLDSERKLVAAVIYNRLREGIPLGIDATTRFATGNYTQPLTESDLATDSPYNTRLNSGLPPGPISSPGLASLEAAARPARVDYLYYVVEPGTCGKHAFSSTDAEFQADVARYNEAREAAGGESPDSC
ncbi:MAG TPA: endolytic transglycosylase MltG [Solirubrobacterales bacterium]|nr:endolytic transglycosylase MltG [Solirubrobacterales bacterium]